MKIAAVVVTYNRLELLKECIASLKSQTQKLDEIFVINNGSTDGTLDWLNTQNDLTVITQENLGGAGGFYTGIKIAYENGYDWIWCMDDDGRPQENTLEKLLEYAQPYSVYHPLVISPNDENIFSFGCWLYLERRIMFKTMKELKNYLKRDEKIFPSFGTPFNGTLISKKVIEKVGFPNPKFFIWGDETEYILRIVHNGYKSFVVLDAFFYHPYNKFNFNLLEMEKKYWWKLYYRFRNSKIYYHFYYNNSFKATLKFLMHNMNNIRIILFSKQNDKYFKIKIILIATIHALINRYGKYQIK